MMDTTPIFNSPPKIAHRGRGNGPTRFEKETAANGGKVDTFGDPPNLGPWVLGDTIGKGSSGRVRLARHNQTGKLAAVKIIPKNIMFTSRMSISNATAKHEKLMLGIRREIVIMKLIDHPNIMSLYDVFEADNELYLLLEYIEGGELFDFLVSKGRLQPAEAVKYFREIIHGVDYCHRFNICHRDLKPENLLLDSRRNIKIADFGMAAMEIANGLLETSCGSPHYASPEIVAGKAYHGAASDIWSCGVVLFALLVGRLPFDDPNMRLLLQKVRAGRFEMPSYLPPEAKDLIRRMLVVNPEARIQMPDILRHPFFCLPSVPRAIAAPEPPSLDEIARDIPSEKHIDRVCLHNLAILWHGTSERKIVEALISPEPTWEKAYYWLLAKYQQKAMEEYDEGYSFGFQSGRWEPPAHLVQRQAGDLRRQREEQAARRHRERDAHTGNRAYGREYEDRQPNRRQHHDSPRSFAVNKDQVTMSRLTSPRDIPPPSPTKRTTGTASRPRPTSVIGPRQPSVHGRQPSLVDEEQDRKRMPPPPCPPMVRRATVPYDSPQAVKLEPSSPRGGSKPSETTDADVFQSKSRFAAPGGDIPSRSTPVTPNIDRPAGKDGASKLLVPTASPKGLGISFAQAGEGPSSTPMSPRNSRSATVPSPTSTHRKTTTQAIDVPSVQDPALQKFFNEVAGVLNNLQSPPPTPAKPALSSTASPGRNQNYVGRNGSSIADEEHSGSSVTAGRQRASTVLARRVSQKGGSRTPNRANIGEDYVLVNDQDAQVLPGHGPTKKSRPAPLDMSAHSRALTSGPSPVPSPLLTGSDFTRGQGWFSSLFNFKPATFTLFSFTNVNATRKECAKILELFGVNVALEEGGDGNAMLKCNVDKLYDHAGTIHAKPVRFRVQFTSGSNNGSYSMPSTPAFSHSPSPTPSPFLSPSSAPSTSGCTITLVQERGARSSLEAVAQRLRHEWNLDSLASAQPSPMLDASQVFAR